MFDVGDVIDGDYTVVEILGGGGMGVVLRVVDPDGEEYALKYCADSDETRRRRFAREVRVMEGIDHPHVIPVLGSNLKYDPPYFLMPVATCSLAEELAANGPDEAAALASIRQICAGLAAIHAAGATHRDVKPLNALRMPDGAIRVSDLGLAKFNERETTTLTETTDKLGSFAYAAPEQFIDGGTRDADARTDVFQAAKTLYELVTGDTPYLIDPKKVDAGLAHVIQRATRNDPEARYASIDEFIEAITAYELAKDPLAHPSEAFDALLKEARDLIAEGRYDQGNLRRMVELIAGFSADSGEVISMADRVPEELLAMLAAEMPDEAERFADLYVNAVDDVIGGYNFERAQVVAKRMRVLFKNTRRSVVKALALEATLIAAVRLNRWAAMDAFNDMLLEVKSGEDAVAVAEMLKRRMREYEVVAEKAKPSKLHAAIRRVRAAAVEPQKATVTDESDG